MFGKQNQQNEQLEGEIVLLNNCFDYYSERSD